MTDKDLYDWIVTPPRVAVLHVERTDLPVTARTAEERLAEAENLFDALGVTLAFSQIVVLSRLNAHTLLGKGKVEEIAARLHDEQVEALFINTALSPGQQRNLERAFEVKVLDRTGIILEIFAQRARTKAARLQVSLAQIHYQQSRLVRSWTHLERQRGSLGKVGGPGERQLELDRRMLLDRATELRAKLKQVQKEQHVQRGARLRHTLPQVALVGYTNAGKSTLFETLTGQIAGSEDKLFATLDPLVRKVTLPSGRDIVLSDTVGFIADLPHELVAAFEATLEEVKSADLIVCVHDAHNPEVLAQAEDVVTVLKEIEADSLPVLNAANKVDLLPDTQNLPFNGIPCSALTSAGVDALLAAIDDHFSAQERVETLQVPASDGKLIAWLHAHTIIQSQVLEEDTWTFTAQFTPALWGQWCALTGCVEEDVLEPWER